MVGFSGAKVAACFDETGIKATGFNWLLIVD
jgi:hypothetical protein